MLTRDLESSLRPVTRWSLVFSVWLLAATIAFSEFAPLAWGGDTKAPEQDPIRAQVFSFIGGVVALGLLGAGLLGAGYCVLSRATMRRREAEISVRDSMNFLQTVIDGIAEPMMVVDRHHKVILTNRTAGEKLEKQNSRPDAAGCYLVACGRDSYCDRKHHPCLLERVIKTKAPFTCTLSQGDTGDGTVFDVFGSPIFDKNGEVAHVVVFLHDVTERHEAEMAVRESEQRFRQVMENMPVMMMALDEESTVVFWNRECERVTGYAADEILWQGDALARLYPNEGYREQIIDGLLSSATFRGWEWEVTCKDGAVRSISWSNISQEFPIPGWAAWAVGVDVTERRLAEEALADSQQFLRSTLDALSAQIAILDESGTILAANLAWRNLSREESAHIQGAPIGTNYLDVCDNLSGDEEAFGEEIAQGIRDVINREREEYAMEYWCAMPSGRRWFMARVTRFKGKGPGRVVMAHQDITERKQAEEALQESEQRLELSVRAAGLGLWDWNIVTGDVVFNHRWAEMLGYRLEEIEPHYRTWTELIHPKDLPEAIRKLNDHIDGKTPYYEPEFRLRAKSGEWRWILCSGQAVEWDAEGNPVRAIGTHLDFTERKRADEQLRILSLAVKQSPSSIVITDTAGQIEYVNEKFTQVTGYSREEALGENPRILKSEGTPQEVHKDMWATITGGREWRGEIRNRKKNGEHYWESASISPILDEEGNITHFVAIKEDITKQKQTALALLEAKEEAERANQAKSEFLSRMSHELRTPLNSILGFAQLLETDPSQPLTELQDESVSQILKAGNHLLALINEILDLARIESGRLTLSMESVELGPLVEEVMALIDPLAEQYGIAVKDNTAPHYHTSVVADRTRLKQVLLNLLSNAVKYNRENGSVTIDCEYIEDKRLRIRAVDTGPGISLDQENALFEPFNRLGADQTPVEGTGIGLAICKRLIDMMGGTIGVESTPGEGSCFYIDLDLAKHAPLVMDPPTIGLNTAPLDPVGRAYTVLYIEDNPANLELVRHALSREPDIELKTALDAQSGIDLARADRPDLILLDINLPGMDGYEALNYLLADERTRDIPVIAVSASAMPADIHKGMNSGFANYLTKPLDLPLLLKEIKNAFKSKESL